MKLITVKFHQIIFFQKSSFSLKPLHGITVPSSLGIMAG